MNEKTARQIAEMKNQTIGVEVEMNSITRQKAAKVARRLLRHRQIREHCRPQRLQHLVGLGRTGREWKFQKDVSIAGRTSRNANWSPRS